MSKLYGSLDPVEDAIDALEKSEFHYIVIAGIAEDTTQINANCPFDPEFEEAIIEQLRQQFQAMREDQHYE